AETALVIDAKSYDPIAGGVMPSQLIANHIATQVDISDSDRVALRVVDAAGLAGMPQFQQQWQEATGGAGDIREWIADVLLSRLDVTPGRESNVVRISYTAS
ncbi:chain length determinant protein EpsF, partial [Aromatoleum toluclasticum]|nr:chain length determinant protein EpsF [Aromatoleum toluclasticum]